MVERMRPGALAAFVLLAASAGSHAQALVDPTRPPNASAASAPAGAAGPAAMQLQSVLISPGRKVAVINGETVLVGGHFGDATLVRIEATRVTLRRGDELEVLGMYTGIEKKTVRRRAPGAKPGARVDAAEKGQRK